MRLSLQHRTPLHVPSGTKLSVNFSLLLFLFCLLVCFGGFRIGLYRYSRIDIFLLR